MFATEYDKRKAIETIAGEASERLRIEANNEGDACILALARREDDRARELARSAASYARRSMAIDPSTIGGSGWLFLVHLCHKFRAELEG